MKISSIVKVGTLQRFVDGLAKSIEGGGSAQSREVAGRTTITALQPEFWFPGQCVDQGGSVYVYPFWVLVANGGDGELIGLGDTTITCPAPGVIQLVTTYTVTWAVVGGVVEVTTVFDSCQIVAASTLTPSTPATVTIQAGTPPVIVSQSNQSVRVEPLAYRDASGNITHAAFTFNGINTSVGELLLFRTQALVNTFGP